jgi:hypothetical protein
MGVTSRILGMIAVLKPTVNGFGVKSSEVLQKANGHATPTSFLLVGGARGGYGVFVSGSQSIASV